jgi:Uma2 family endonuclease
MSTILESPARSWTAIDLAERFGPIPLDRVRLQPRMATEQDVVELRNKEKRLYELIEGILVEKAMGAYESYLAALLIGLLQPFVDKHRLGVVLGADGLLRLSPGAVRIPDVSFISWDRLPGRRLDRTPILDRAPDLAVEVISEGNTVREMESKVLEYFAAGVQQVWLIYPVERELVVFRSPSESRTYNQTQTVTLEDVLAGFQLDLARFFAEPADHLN